MTALGALGSKAQQSFLRALHDREARLVALFSLLSIGGGFLGNRWLTQVARPEALGTYYLYANLSQWLALPAASGFVYVVHHWPIFREHGDTARFSRAIAISSLLLGAIALIGASLMRLSGQAGLDSLWPVLFVALLAFGGGVFQLLSPLPAAEHWRGWSGTLNLLGGTARPFVQAALLILLGASTASGLLGSAAALQLLAAAASLCIYLRIYRLTRSPHPPQPSEQLSLRAFLSYSIPGFFGVLIPQLATSIERFGLARSQDTAATALFVQAMGISVAVMGALSGVIVSYHYPFATNAAARDTVDPLGAAAHVLKPFFLMLAVALGSVALVIALGARPFTALAFGPRYAGVAPLIPWTVIGATLFSLAAALTIALFIARDAFWPNLARIASQLAYVAALIFLPRGSDPAGRFVREYACAQLLYLLLVLFAIARNLARRRAQIAAG